MFHEERVIVSIKKRRSAADDFDVYFRDLRREFEEWGGKLFERPSWNQKASTIEPLRDMIVAPTEVVVTVDLPFTRENTLQVRALDENTIEISAKMKRKMSFKEMGITHHVGEFQRFHFQSRIPVPVQMKKMKIRFRKGMLEVHIPRGRARSESRSRAVGQK
jgi:HSP20 family molecular chaperone IbpA